MGCKKNITICVLSLQLFFLNSCGNSIVSIGSNKNSIVTYLDEADKAYQSKNYSKAIRYYEKAIDKDETNQKAHLGLAYSLLSSVKLGVFDLLKKSLQLDEQKKNNPSESTSDITKTISLFGAETEEVSLIIQAIKNQNELSYFWEASERTRYLKKVWFTLCPLLSKQPLENIYQIYPKLVVPLNKEYCFKNYGSREKLSGDFNLAGLLMVVGTIAVIYQTILDSNSDGKIDLQEKADSISKELKDLNAKIPAASASKNLNDLPNLLKDINSKVSAFNDIKKVINNELYSLTFAYSELLEEFLDGIIGLPDSLKNSIRKAIDKFSSAKETLSATSKKVLKAETTTSTNTSSISNSLSSSTDSVDKIYTTQLNKINSSTLSEQEKSAKVEEMNQQLNSVCQNYEELIVGMANPPPKPSSCL